MTKRLFGILVAMGCTGAALAVDLAVWTFEVSVPAGTGTTNGPHAAEGGVNAGPGSPADGFHALPATAWSNPVGNGSAESWSSNTWSAGDFYAFRTSTLGYENIIFSFDQTRSNTGPATFDVELSVDNGATWTTLVDNYTVLFNDASNGGVWNSTTRILNYAFGPIAAPPSASNQAAVIFRLVSQVTPAAGGTNRVDNVVIAGTLPVFGACCRDGVCATITQTNCQQLGGTFLGEGIPCDPNPCLEIPVGACCREGQCQVLPEPDCIAGGGQFQGDGVSCDPNPCPPPTGACCRITGDCVVVTAAQCDQLGGQYQGNNTDCDPNPCPQPTGACCVVGCCVDGVTQAQCGAVGGLWSPLLTCDQIPACPLPDPDPHFVLSEIFINPPGTDQGLEAVEILGTPNTSLAGHWLVVIEGDTNPAGTVDQLVYLGGFSTGANGLLLIRDDPNGPAYAPSPSPLTSIAFHNFTPDIENGANTFVLARGVPAFAVGTDLDPTNSGAIAGLPGLCPVDAVSFVDGVDGGLEYADDLGGTALGQVGPYTPDALYRLFDCEGNPVFRWAGGDVVADPNSGLGPWTWDPAENFGFLPEVDPATLTLDLGRLNYVYCPPPPNGACCRAGACTVVSESACVSNGGQYQGDGTTCDPNPCPPPTCLGDADCDGDVDFFDIDPFVAKLGCPASDPVGCNSPCPWQNSDVDQDGDVDFFDIDPFVARLGATCP